MGEFFVCFIYIRFFCDVRKITEMLKSEETFLYLNILGVWFLNIKKFYYIIIFIIKIIYIIEMIHMCICIVNVRKCKQ